MPEKEGLYRAFIKDDEHDVTRGPAESYRRAVQRCAEAEASDWVVETWTEKVS